jgi:hypothetical protein
MTDILIIRILHNLVAECEYERMVFEQCRAIDLSLSYNDFLAYNKKCLEELSPEDLEWMRCLCKGLNSHRIGMMDLEDCGIWKAHCFFYNLEKDIVIVHPR